MVRKSFFYRWILNALLLYLVALILPGITLSGLWAIILAGLVLGLANAIIRPIFIILSLPLNILTLGLFTFVVNALMISLTAAVVGGFSVAGFWTAVLAAILMSIFGAIINGFVHSQRNYSH